MKISVKGLALGLGVMWSLGILCLGWLAAAFGIGRKLVEVIGSVYIGYAPTFFGAIIGALWAFFDGALGGAILALVYNAVCGSK